MINNPQDSSEKTLPQIRFDAFAQGWGLFTRSPLSWLTASFLVLVIVGTTIFFLIVMQIMGPTPVLIERWPWIQEMNRFFATQQGVLIASFVSSLIYTIMSAGLFCMAVLQVRGHQISALDYGQVVYVLPSVIVLSVIKTVITEIGFSLFIFPGLLIDSLLMFSILLAVDRKMGPVASIRESFRTLMPHWIKALLFNIVIFLFLMGGAVLCGIGTLIVLPVITLAITILYNDFYPPEKTVDSQ